MSKKEQAKEVKAALEKIGYKLKDGVNKDISYPNYSGIIGKSSKKVARRSIWKKV